MLRHVEFTNTPGCWMLSGFMLCFSCLRASLAGCQSLCKELPPSSSRAPLSLGAWRRKERGGREEGSMRGRAHVLTLNPLRLNWRSLEGRGPGPVALPAWMDGRRGQGRGGEGLDWGVVVPEGRGRGETNRLQRYQHPWKKREQGGAFSLVEVVV